MDADERRFLGKRDEEEPRMNGSPARQQPLIPSSSTTDGEGGATARRGFKFK